MLHIGAYSQDHGCIGGLQQIAGIAIEVALVIDLLCQNLLAGLGIDHRSDQMQSTLQSRIDSTVDLPLSTEF